MALTTLNNNSLGAVTSAGLPAGAVVQVIKNESTATTSVSSSSYVTSVSANITPSATSSRVKISVCGVYYANHTGNNVSNLFTCHRNGSAVPGHNWSQGNPAHCHYLNTEQTVLATTSQCHSTSLGLTVLRRHRQPPTPSRQRRPLDSTCSTKA